MDNYADHVTFPKVAEVLDSPPDTSHSQPQMSSDNSSEDEDVEIKAPTLRRSTRKK